MKEKGYFYKYYCEVIFSPEVASIIKNSSLKSFITLYILSFFVRKPTLPSPFFFSKIITINKILYF